MKYVEEIKNLGLTNEQYEECLKVLIDKRIEKISDLDWQEICEMYNLPYNNDTLRKANGTIFGGAFVAKYLLDKYSNSQNDISTNRPINFDTTTKMNKDGSWSSNKLLQMTEQQSKDVDYVLKAHGFDDNWQITSLRNSVRQVISKQDGIVTLYASYLTVKPITTLSLKHIEDFYDKLLKRNNQLKKTEKIVKDDKGCMLEIPIFDVHFGKLSLSEDVAEPYNFKIAKKRFNFIIDSVISEVKNKSIDKIIFPIGSDFFHIDNVNNSTTAGTRQDTDLSPSLIFDYGVEILIDAVEKLQHELNAPVELFCVNGNHDFLTSYHAICTLWAYFHNNPMVTVNKNTSPRKYIEFGNVLIGFTHGDKERKRIDGIMQIEAREMWGRTIYHEFHMGHLHSEQTRETNGIILRNLSSVTGTDAWHHQSGYVGSVLKSQSFIWDRETGLKNIIYTNVNL